MAVVRPAKTARMITAAPAPVAPDGCAWRRDAGSWRTFPTDFPDVPAERRRTRTGRTPGRKPEPGGRRAGNDRPGSAAVQHRTGTGFDRRARTGAGDQQALRL